MRPISRRRFSQGLGVTLALAGPARRVAAHDGPHTLGVAIGGFVFRPAMVTIAPGDSVEWVNDDLAPHTATARDGTWDTGTIGHRDRAAVVFAEEGDFPYLCTFHPHMTGLVTVRARVEG